MTNISENGKVPFIIRAGCPCAMGGPCRFLSSFFFLRFFRSLSLLFFPAVTSASARHAGNIRDRLGLAVHEAGAVKAIDVLAEMGKAVAGDPGRKIGNDQ